MGLLDILGPFKWVIVLGAVGAIAGLIILTLLFLPASIFTVPILVVLFGFIALVFMGILGIDKRVRKNCTMVDGKVVCDF